MTIPTPAFILVDDCPGWCDSDHVNIYSDPGEHACKLAEFNGGDSDFELYASGHSGLQVKLWARGDEAMAVPAAEAVERLTELARAALTAIYRLGVIESAEHSVAISEKVSYSLDFPPGLLPLTSETLRLINA